MCIFHLLQAYCLGPSLTLDTITITTLGTEYKLQISSSCCYVSSILTLLRPSRVQQIFPSALRNKSPV